MTTNEISFHDPIPKLKLASFDSMPVLSVEIGGKGMMLKADRDLFARLLVFAHTRGMDLQEVFKYSLGPPPWLALASADESICKTAKSKLLETLIEGVEPAEDVPSSAALIVDGMAVLQGLKDIPATFEELATSVFHLGFPQTTLARRVTDRYSDVFIKNPERAKRASEEAVKVNIAWRWSRCPKQWKFKQQGEQEDVNEISLSAVLKGQLNTMQIGLGITTSILLLTTSAFSCLLMMERVCVRRSLS